MWRRHLRLKLQRNDVNYALQCRKASTVISYRVFGSWKQHKSYLGWLSFPAGSSRNSTQCFKNAVNKHRLFFVSKKFCLTFLTSKQQEFNLVKMLVCFLKIRLSLWVGLFPIYWVACVLFSFFLFEKS